MTVKTFWQIVSEVLFWIENSWSALGSRNRVKRKTNRLAFGNPRKWYDNYDKIAPKANTIQQAKEATKYAWRNFKF